MLVEHGEGSSVCSPCVSQEDLFAAVWDIVLQIYYPLFGSFFGKQELKWKELVSNCWFQAWQATAAAGGMGGSRVKILKCWLSLFQARYLTLKLEDTQRFSLGRVSEAVYNSFLCCVWMKYFVSHEMYSQSQRTAEREADCTWPQTSSSFRLCCVFTALLLRSFCFQKESRCTRKSLPLSPTQIGSAQERQEIQLSNNCCAWEMFDQFLISIEYHK